VVFGWLMGSGLHPETSAIVSWFGPARGSRGRTTSVVSGFAAMVARFRTVVALVLVWPMVGAVAASSRSEITCSIRSAEPGESVVGPTTTELLAQALGSRRSMDGRGASGSQPYPHSPGAVGVGGALLVLAGLGVWRRRYRKLALSALVVGVLGIVLMMRIPPLDWILVRIPPLDHMTLPRWGVLIPWAMVVLASLAVDWVVRGGDVPTIRRLLPLVVVGGAVWIVGDVSVVGTGLTLAAGLATAAVVGRRDAIVPLIVVLEVGALAIGVNPTADPADRQPSSDVIRFVQREVADSGGRIVGTRRSFTPNLASRYGLEDLRSWDPVRAVPFVRLMRVLGEPEAIMGGPLNDLPSGLVGAWHVRWAVTRPPVELGPGWLLRFSSPSGRVYENAHHLPPVRAVGRAIPEPENVAEIRQVVQGMDFARVALVDGAATGVAATSVRVDDVLFDPDRIEVTVRSDGPCLVVAARPWAPGWNVWVDGAPAALRRTNVAGLGAVVPQGEHRVAFIYRPWRW
jgi:MYXO-CTERM domain-containing protein